MSEAARLNLDTSVMVNYVYSQLPSDLEEDRGCQRLIDGESFYTVIGGKANGEFDALCDRRYNLYDDVVAYLRDSDNEIFDYDPRDRDIHVSPNDRSHFREDIQMSWYNMDKREQLATLRRCLQDIELYQVQLPDELIDRCFPQQSNDQLLRRFGETSTLAMIARYSSMLSRYLASTLSLLSLLWIRILATESTSILCMKLLRMYSVYRGYSVFRSLTV